MSLTNIGPNSTLLGKMIHKILEERVREELAKIIEAELKSTVDRVVGELEVYVEKYVAPDRFGEEVRVFIMDKRK